VGLALLVFVYFNAYGIWENGLLGYLRHFAGPVSGSLLFLVGPVIFCAEIFSTLLRPFTLNLRLYWNIKADHILMETIHNLLGPFSIGVASPLFVLALFVSFMQAFVFAMLTMIYVLLATAHEEDH
jgi:F-type H+-transporting ATPase subunit a